MNDNYSNADLTSAHTRSSMHREEIETSTLCGCFFCCEIYSSEKIEEWIDEGQTAICPECGIDAVIGDASRFPIEKEFLAALRAQWF